jgi:lipoprotein-anchoring transpeptidase ErfK/SrfK
MLKRLLALALFVGLSTPAFASSGGLFDDLFGPASHGSMSSESKSDVPSGHLLITIDIANQEMTVQDDWHTVYTWNVSTARHGYSTPTGTFRPVRMNEIWYSSKYENSPMPWSIFFHGGYAIHGTEDVRHLGHVASHGCVRLDPRNAKLLYDLVSDVGMQNVKIVLHG